VEHIDFAAVKLQ